MLPAELSSSSLSLATTNGRGVDSVVVVVVVVVDDDTTIAAMVVVVVVVVVRATTTSIGFGVVFSFRIFCRQRDILL